MTLWHERHAYVVADGNFSRATVSPQSFLIYDKAGLLHMLVAQGAAEASSEGFGSRRGKRGL